jgi:hypothetical protein
MHSITLPFFLLFSRDCVTLSPLGLFGTSLPLAPALDDDECEQLIE